MSKIEPDDYLRWREAGLGALDALRLPAHFAKAGLSIDDFRRWRAAGLGGDLAGFVPHLMSGLSFDELVNVLTAWTTRDDSENVDGAYEFKTMLINGLALDEFRQQLETGLSGHQIYTWTGAGIPASEAKPWADVGLAANDALAFMKAKVPVETAQEWIAAGIAGAGALDFIARGVTPEDAQVWTDAGFSSRDAVDYIHKGVPIEDALNFAQRGIQPWQVKRTKAGLSLRLHPWQKDPAHQLRRGIKRGRIKFTLWTDALGSGPQAHDIVLKWDGKHTVEWSEDISPDGGDLSPASSSPTWGVASWPNGRDVLLTYTWYDLGLRGYARLVGAAPTPDSAGVVAPDEWIRFGKALVDFVLLDLGSGKHEPNELAGEYYCPSSNRALGLDEAFRVYLKAAGGTAVPEGFDEWLRNKLSDGSYTTEVDYARLEAAAAARAAKPRVKRAGGLGKNQSRIIKLLQTATKDGLGTDELARSLGIKAESTQAAMDRLANRQMVVLTAYGSIAWLPKRRLAWLQAQALPSPAVEEEIAELSALVEE
ncbi:MAG: hypothetical protein ACKOI2_04810 [Actinomycetota bacterium]